jgi:hypothetical protein
MPLQEQQLFTLEEAANLMKTSTGHVSELLTSRAFRQVVIEKSTKTGGDWITHYYFDESEWPYQKKDGTVVRTSANEWHYLMPPDVTEHSSDRSDTESECIDELISPDKWLEDAKRILIPKSSLEDVMVQLESNLTPSNISLWKSLSSLMKTIKSPRLKAALAAYHEFYVCNKIESNRGHSAQIKDWLGRTYGALSRNEIDSIAAVVNLDPRRPQK